MTDETQKIEPAVDTKPQETKPNPTIAQAPKEKVETKTIIQKRGGVSFFTSLLMSTAAMVGGAYLSLFVSARPDVAQSIGLAQFLPKAQQTANIIPSDLTNQIGALRQDLTQLQNKVGATPPNSIGAPIVAGAQAPNAAPAPQQQINLDPLKAQIEGLSGRLTAIETRLAALDPTGTGGAIIAALQADIATLKVNFEALNSRVASTPSPAVTFAIMSLAEATNRSGGFMPEYSSVKAALPNVPEVLGLEGLALNGAPTRAVLEKDFADLAALLIEDKKSVKNEGGLTGAIRTWFASLIKVEVKEEKPDPNSQAAIYDRAKVKLMGGDLQGAVTEIDTIAQKSPEMVKWIANARNRLDLDNKIAALRGAIERGLSSAPSPAIQAPVIAAKPPLIAAPTQASPPQPAQVVQPAQAQTQQPMGNGK